MKGYDYVRVISDDYKEENIHKGEVGTIWFPEIRDDEFYVQFDTGNPKDWYKYASIKIKDLELVKDGGCTDEELLSELPKNNPKWWCKVEDGYIMNLLGEKKNKIPYNYNS